jgi:hypothetical protein
MTQGGGVPNAETLDTEHEFPCSFLFCTNIKLSVHPRIGIEFVSLETLRKYMYETIEEYRGARGSLVG